MSAVTQWFPASTTPDRKGVYEVNDCGDPSMRFGWFAYWDGKKFGYRTFDPATAFAERSMRTYMPKRTSWRGLAVKP